jgi:hypothetical protein
MRGVVSYGIGSRSHYHNSKHPFPANGDLDFAVFENGQDRLFMNESSPQHWFTTFYTYMMLESWYQAR